MIAQSTLVIVASIFIFDGEMVGYSVDSMVEFEVGYNVDSMVGIDERLSVGVFVGDPKGLLEILLGC